MSTATQSRETVLAAVRAATSGVACAPARLAEACQAVPRPYDHAGTLDREARLALLVARLREYGAEVVSTTPAALPAAIAAQLKATGKRRFAAPEGLPAEWLDAGFEWRVDRELPTAEIEHCDGVLTAASAAIADSGTIVLHHGPREGRRLLSLLPDTHVCVLLASQVVETLPEYFQRCLAPPALVTWISGPSATADIEMTRIKGVHGPRFLHVVLVLDQPS
ncbi:MAG: LUD domain-containing protein [Terracidiphilus sp.]